MLSAKELHQIFTAEGGLPAKGGQKDYCPDGSLLYKRKLENFYEDRRNLLKQERVRVLGSLIQGEWLPNEGRVKLEKQGKFSKSMGYAENGKHYLLPEEAMFLLDQGVVQIHHGGIPISIQEALSLLLLPTVSLDQYHVFAYFCRLGYILRRYTGPMTYEKKIGLLKCKMGNKRKMEKLDSTKEGNAHEILQKKSKVTAVSDEDTNPVAAQVDISDSAEQNESEERSDHNGKEDSKDGGDAAERLCSCEESFVPKQCDVCVNCEENQEELDDVDMCPPLPYTTWDFTELDFPDISTLTSTTKEYSFVVKSGAYLPPGVQLSGRRYNVDVSVFRASAGHREEALDFSHGAGGMASKLTAQNWSEYKLQMCTDNDDDILLTSPVGHLWRGDVKPLIKPHQATCTRDILEKLKVVKNSHFSATKQCLTPPSEDQTLPKIVYDGYFPSSKFKKTQPGLPQFRLVITSQRCRVPDLYTLSSVNTESQEEQVRVYWAVVECGEVIFFSFNDVDLPQDIVME